MRDPHEGMKHTGPNREPRKIGPTLEELRASSAVKELGGVPGMSKDHIRYLNGVIGHHNKHKLGRRLPFIKKDGSRYAE